MKLKTSATPIAFIGLVLLFWQFIVHLLAVPAYLLPPPTAIIAAFDSNLLLHLSVTTVEALAGFFIGSGFAFVCALLFVRSPMVERSLFPLAVAIKTTPLVAIAPLLVLWMGTGWWSKIVAAALICFFPVLVNTVKGLKSPDQEYFELFNSFDSAERQVFLKLRIPYCLPYFFSALKISSSLAVVGAIVGEFVGATHGLGYVIMVSSSHLDTDILFSAIFAAAALGILLFHLVGWIENKVLFWQTVEAD